VRHYVVQNALYWFHEYHVDGLRLDSVPNIFDMSSRHILAEIADEIRKAEDELGKRQGIARSPPTKSHVAVMRPE
jgi:1,4-alpha-glucan branching enzyme